MTVQRIATAVAGSLAVLIIVAAPASLAFAHQGSDDASESGNSSSGTTSNSGSSSHNDSDTQKEPDSNKSSESGSSSSGRQSKPEDSTTHKSGETANTTLATDDSSKHGGRLDTAKKKVCENREGNITTIMNRRVVWAERHVALFTTISERTQKFYDEQGKTLAGYSALVSAANNAKATAQADLTALKVTAVFDCDSDSPKASITAYKAAFDKEKQSLKAYRTAVKNLVAGVKSVQGEDN